MDATDSKEYYRGYTDGYAAGVSDALRGSARQPDHTKIESFPVGVMTISSRGRNCLTREGCVTVADVAALDARTIRSMRSMGEKTASEIGHWLDDHGLRFTAWREYL